MLYPCKQSVEWGVDLGIIIFYLSIPLLCQVHNFLERSYLAQVKECLKLGHDPWSSSFNQGQGHIYSINIAFLKWEKAWQRD